MKGPLAVLTLLVAGFLVYGTVVGSPFVAFYTAVTVLAGAGLGLVHRRVGFPRPLLWALVAVAAGNLAGGVLLVGGSTLYVHRLGGTVPYDLAFHAAASAVGGWAGAVVVEARHDRAASAAAAALVATLVAVGAGAVVEVVEFTGTLLFPNTNVGDYRNNMLDLVANLAGAAVGASLAVARRPARHRSPLRGRVGS